ncbi:MAG: hypothetical protein MHMPM18_001017 [Marteilia pararefringens]
MPLSSLIDLSGSDDSNEILNEDSIPLIDSYDEKWQDSPYNVDYENLKICESSDYSTIDPIPNTDDSISIDYGTLNENQVSQGDVFDKSLHDFPLNNSDDSMLLGNSDNIFINPIPSIQDNPSSDDDILNIDKRLLYNVYDQSCEDFHLNDYLDKSMICGVPNNEDSEVSGASHRSNEIESDQNPNGTSNRDEDTKGVEYLLSVCRSYDPKQLLVLSNIKSDILQKISLKHLISSDKNAEIVHEITARFEILFSLVSLKGKSLQQESIKKNSTLRDRENDPDLDKLKRKRSKYKSYYLLLYYL